MFSVLHHRSEPVAAFSDIPHWISPARALVAEAGAYERERVYVPAGCFYALSTPPPSDEELIAARKQASDLGVAGILYPCVRAAADRGPLERAGFRPFPWFIESVFEVVEGVEADLRGRLGGARFRDLRRLHRKYEQDYALDVHDAGDLRGSMGAEILEAFDFLHRKNLEKFGHVVNFYDFTVMETLLSSGLGERVLACFSRDRKTGRRVQTLLALVDHESQEMQLLVQGIDENEVLPGHNVYQASLYGLYAWGEARGIRTFNLGRGRQRDKLRLGANRFHVLSNYLLRFEAKPDGILDAVNAAAFRKMERDLRELSDEGGIVAQAFPTSEK